MKESIDLTENRAFSNQTLDNGVYSKEYNHNKLPWKRAGSDEPAQRITDRFNWSSSSSRTTISTLGMNASNTWLNTTEWDELDFTTTSTNGTSYSSSSFSDRFYYIDNRIDTISYIVYNTNGSITYGTNAEPVDRIFPIGKRDEIKMMRIKDYKIDRYEKYRQSCKCEICDSRIKTTPWMDKKVHVVDIPNYNDWYYDEFATNMITYLKIMSRDDRCIRLCDDCYMTVNPLINRIKREKDKKECKRSWILYQRWAPKWWKSTLSHKLGRGLDITDVFGFIPCISSDIKIDINQRKFKARYKEWDFGAICEDELKVHLGELRKRHKVYYKGFHTWITRALPWQPNGRIEQDYDILFDNMDWRTMLQKRIGEYDEPLVDDNFESFLDTIETTNIDFSYLISNNGIHI